LSRVNAGTGGAEPCCLQNQDFTAPGRSGSADGGQVRMEYDESVASPTKMVDLGQDIASSRIHDTKQRAKYPSLSAQVVARDPEYLPFANHRRRFNVAKQRRPARSHRANLPDPRMQHFPRNGFTPKLRAELLKRFKSLSSKQCPFANLPEKKAGRCGVGLTAA